MITPVKTGCYIIHVLFKATKHNDIIYVEK